MLIKSAVDTVLKYYKGNECIEIKPNTVTCVADGLVTEKELKDCYGTMVHVLTEKEFDATVKEGAKEAPVEDDVKEDTVNEAPVEDDVKEEAPVEDDVKEDTVNEAPVKEGAKEDTVDEVKEPVKAPAKEETKANKNSKKNNKK